AYSNKLIPFFEHSGQFLHPFYISVIEQIRSVTKLFFVFLVQLVETIKVLVEVHLEKIGLGLYHVLLGTDEFYELPSLVLYRIMIEHNTDLLFHGFKGCDRLFVPPTDVGKIVVDWRSLILVQLGPAFLVRISYGEHER